MKVLVTGSDGQLGSELKVLEAFNQNLDFVFVDIKTLDITDEGAVEAFFKSTKFDYCVNCAAYTAVDKAESDIETATKVNVLGPQLLAKYLKQQGGTFIQISTDFVFDGATGLLYNETDKPNPLSVYGDTKLKGEVAVLGECPESIVIRTAWLYSSFGNNFVKTMRRLGTERDALGVVVDQIGTPTYARDLASVVIAFINKRIVNYGIYHYSNEGVASWYDFAHSIFGLFDINVDLSPIPSSNYPTPAKRPSFSVMDKKLIKDVLGITIPHWRDSLSDCVDKLKNEPN